VVGLRVTASAFSAALPQVGPTRASDGQPGAQRHKVGPLRSPHNDIAVIGTVLEELGFRTILVKDPD